MLKRGLVLIVGVWSGAMAQTPPVKVQTPDVKVPPAIQLQSPAVPDKDAPSAPLTAADAVSIALRRQSSLVVARADVRAAQGRVLQARSQLYPQLGLNGSASDVRITGTGGGGGFNPSRFSTSVTVNQLLFDFLRTLDSVRQQEALERASAHVLTATESDLALQVKQAFYGFSEAAQLVQVSEENVANRQRQLALANAQLEQGIGQPGDVVRAKTNLADAVIALTTARTSATTAGVNLAQLMGIDPRTPLSPAPSTEAAPPTGDLISLVESAMADRPEIAAAKERVIAARFGSAAAAKTSAPRLGFNASLATRGADGPFETKTSTVGVTIGWTFGDGGLAAGRSREARALEEAARAILVDATQQVVADVSQAFVDVKSAEQRLETAKVQLVNARELVRISEGRYQGGIGQFLDLTDAQSSLVTAERNVAQAEADLQRSRAALSRAVGRR